MHCSGAGRFSILRTSGCRFSRVRAFAVPERSCLWAGRAADFANSACRAYETAIPENLTDEGCSDMLIFSGMRRAPMLCSGLLQSARREYGRAATSLVLVATSFTLQFARREDGRACDGRAAALGRAPAILRTSGSMADDFAFCSAHAKYVLSQSNRFHTPRGALSAHH